MSKEIYSPELEDFKQIVDADNGEGYHVNITMKGNFVKFDHGTTKMLYEIKNLEGVKIVFIKYIHYETKKELLSLLAFATQWWKNLKPSLVYYREKERKHRVGKVLKELGFEESTIPNTLEPFDCLIDGRDCNCTIYEYVIHG